MVSMACGCAQSHSHSNKRTGTVLEHNIRIELLMSKLAPLKSHWKEVYYELGTNYIYLA